MRTSLVLVILAAMAILAACGGAAGVEGSGTTAAESRDVEPFSGVRVQGAADIVVAIGEPQSLVVETDDNLLRLLETSVEGDTLRIRFSERVRQSSGVGVQMTVPALDAVTVDGAAGIEIGEMAGGELAITINGSATVYASGHADVVDIDVKGAGVLRMFDLTAESVEISIAGNGEVEVHATRSLRATLTGSGRVTYEGDPQDLETSVSGSGSIERRSSTS